ncbi:MAG: PT domain-containing protein [Chloroflexi bacterium]|nr:PT domain-containing protein [Chloroflexota bacterium]
MPANKPTNKPTNQPTNQPIQRASFDTKDEQTYRFSPKSSGICWQGRQPAGANWRAVG